MSQKLRTLEGELAPKRRERDPTHSAMKTSPGGADRHTHCLVFFGETGRGFSSPGPDGHVHRVRDLEVLEAAGHTHDLSASRCLERHHPETGRHVHTRQK